MQKHRGLHRNHFQREYKDLLVEEFRCSILRDRTGSFLSFGCIAKPGEVVYPNYQELVDDMFKKKAVAAGL